MRSCPARLSSTMRLQHVSSVYSRRGAQPLAARVLPSVVRALSRAPSLHATSSLDSPARARTMPTSAPPSCMLHGCRLMRYTAWRRKSVLRSPTRYLLLRYPSTARTLRKAPPASSFIMSPSVSPPSTRIKARRVAVLSSTLHCRMRGAWDTRPQRRIVYLAMSRQSRRRPSRPVCSNALRRRAVTV